MGVDAFRAQRARGGVAARQAPGAEQHGQPAAPQFPTDLPSDSLVPARDQGDPPGLLHVLVPSLWRQDHRRRPAFR